MFLSTPYEAKSAAFLHRLGVCAFKIASTDLNNIPLIRLISGFGRPVLISCGMSTVAETKESIDAIRREGNNKIVLMHTTSNYPPEYKDANINNIESLRDKLNVLVGYSDHYALPETAIASHS